MSEHFRHQVMQGRLHTGLTGVLPSYRRKGIALALKIKAIKALCIKDLSTWNASHNTGMLALNKGLGFQKQPASIDYQKKL